MLELGVGADLVRGVGWILWGLIALGLWLAVSKPKTLAGKVICTALVLAVPVAILGPAAYRGYEYRKRYEVAKAHFDERCKTAGEKIYKTVEGVEGIAIERLRPRDINYGDQYELDDPYGQGGNGQGDFYAHSFLNGRKDRYWLTEEHARGAYKYVDLLEGETKATRYRVERKVNAQGVAIRSINKSSESQASPYLLRWSDASTQEDRDHWVACGRVEILVRDTGERLGERTGCMFDRGLGSKSGGRSPWLFARNQSCPEPRRTAEGRAYRDPIDRNFAEKVLQPVQGE